VIARLAGRIVTKGPSRMVVDVHGVGYEVFVSLSTFSATPAEGNDVALDIHTHVREDAISLYGFSSSRERIIFEKLIGISGIGPKLAVTILSGAAVDELIGAIRRNDLGRLTAIPGVGKKTAERIVVELKDKLKDFAEGPTRGAAESDVLSALENLGYPRGHAEAALTRAMDGAGDSTFDGLFKRTLLILTKG
jgi:Holliday junction DNA helicase RuvA